MQNKNLHLIKLAVGANSIQTLRDYQQNCYLQQKRKKQTEEFVHVTRQMPKRAEELLAGGSLYWVIKGYISAHQRIVELRPLIVGNIAHCGIVLAPEIIRTVPRSRRPFQGWRYLYGTDAPPDLDDEDTDDAPESMLRELSELGLI
jgi:hypothetical protein